MLRRVALFTFTVPVLLFAYQNCSLDATHVGSSVQSSFKGCDTATSKAFTKSGYYSLFRSKCAGCHEPGGNGMGKFAASDLNVAFSEFQNLGRTRVERNMLRELHQGPAITGPINQPLVDRSKAMWDSADAAALDCKGTRELAVADKAIPATVYTTTPADAAAWPTISWDLSLEGRSPTQAKVDAIVTLQVRRLRRDLNADGTLDNAGYEFKTPQVRLKAAGGTYQFQGMHILINGVVINDITLYSKMDVIVNSTTNVNMMGPSGNAFIALPIANSDLLAVKFDGVFDANGQPIDNNGGGGGGGGGGLPARVTYTQLTSNDATLGIIQRNCVSCHSAGRADGGLNLQSYAAAASAGPNIRARVNNSNNPMPPGRFMSSDERAVIDIWANSGYPQN